MKAKDLKGPLVFTSALLVLITASSSLAQDQAPKNQGSENISPKEKTTASATKAGKKSKEQLRVAAQAMMRRWRKQHLLQQASQIDAELLNLKLLRLKRKKDPKLEDTVKKLEQQAQKTHQDLRVIQQRAKASFYRAGHSVDQALKADTENADVHSWRAELYATMANSGRSIGEVLGPNKDRLLPFSTFRRGLVSAHKAHAAKPLDPRRCHNKARLLGVFNQFETAKTLLEALRKAGKLREEDRVLLATMYFYLNDFQKAGALLERIDEQDASQKQAIDLKKINNYASGQWQKAAKKRAAAKQQNNNPLVVLELTKGRIVLELFEDDAPNTVANFIHLVEKGFYNKTRFHRVISNFMAQGGCPLSRREGGNPKLVGQGGPGWRIKDEGGKNARSHFRGSLSMARSRQPNSAGSQFFICICPLPYLDQQNTVFGRVKSGMKYVDRLRAGSSIVKATVQRKRKHAYKPETLPDN